MKPYWPTLEGFRAIARRPSIGVAEIAWRWSFGAAVGTLLAFSFLEYLNTLSITRGEVLLLKTRHPVLVSQVMQHVFRGSGLRVVESVIVLAVTLAAGWIVVAGLGRAATMQELLAYFRVRREPSSEVEAARIQLRALFGLNVFQVAITVAATVGCLAAFLLAGLASSATEPSPGAAFLVFLLVATLVGLAWSMLHWLLILASVFAAAAGHDSFGSVVAAVDLCCQRTGAVLAVGTWFGLSHLVAFFVASVAAGVVMNFAQVLPPGVILGGIALVTLLYFAVADYLYVGRLAAYVAILEWPELPVATQGAEPLIPKSNERSALGNQPGDAVDPEELILSDLPVPGVAAGICCSSLH